MGFTFGIYHIDLGVSFEKMKFFIVNTDYQGFIHDLYTRSPGLERRSYAEQYTARMDSLFGTADFYSRNLQHLGHEAWDVIANIEPLQKQWAHEQHVSYHNQSGWKFYLRRGQIPWIRRETHRWMYDILAAQIKAYRPDILYCMAIETLGSEFLHSVEGAYRLAIGQHAAPLPTHDIKKYDLILSSLPNQVEYFRQQGIKSELFRLGFEPRILESLSARPKVSHCDIAFVGGLAGPHSSGVQFLEELCRNFRVRAWGYGAEGLPADSGLRKVFKGPIWGKEMYQALRDAKIVFNRHISIAEQYANNMRLYEATGVGSLLLTDAKQNLNELFIPKREVLAYNGVEGLKKLVEYYLIHEQESEAIAHAGQLRTIHDHTWYHRMEELLKIVAQYI